ncbi:DNA protecting protein DprA [Candidatus Woesebacteria bacterium RIFCSPHIGHO2_01_FULL_38_10]|nr:MAG: DNA protecting protein DprA [Candidatus Woesebacteria bacterium RIFCSPHIGHO2_01_FULL_38_10]
MTEREYLVVLYSYTYFGPARTKLLISFFGSAKSVWGASKLKLTKTGIKTVVVDNFIQYRKNFDLANYFSRLKRGFYQFVTINDSNYPKNLKDLDDAPLVLYIKGKILPSDINAVSIVGSRKMTSYGREVTTRFASELASLGVTIVSGLAFGVDAMAHKVCLEHGGRTIAVLASGLDIITPKSNFFLAREIIRRGGAIVSEYPLGYPPLRTNFPNRNRVISGLSKAVIVIEGAKKSGTLLTASAAAEQGRPVFAVPGQITSPLSEAPNFLIQNGAKMATSSKDILEELNMQLKVDLETLENLMPSTPDEKKLLEILANEPLHLNEIARISSLKVSSVSANLSVMELKGMVKNVGNGIYKKI